MQTVLFNDFKKQWDDTRPAMLAAFEAVGASGWYVLGNEVKQFESALANYWGVAFSVGLASGLDAIEIALRVLGCEPGDLVLTTPISAFATTLAIVKLGAVPVYAPVDQYGLVDLDRCEEIFTAQPEIRFFLPVHLYGHCLDIGRLEELRERFDLRIVEDCAQSIGAAHNGRGAGMAGQLAATSFYPTKNLGAIGDGGAILTGDADFAARAAEYRNYGQTAKYRHELIGYNSRLDELQAALLGRVALGKLPEWTGRRRQIARDYMGHIANRYISVPGSPLCSESSWHLFPVLIQPEHKAGFMDWMTSRGIAVAEHYPEALFDQPAMASTRYEIAGGAADARAFCHSEVSLPIHPYLTSAESDYVVEACNSWRPQ
ncbi:MAG: DegT/DnrJ/EryC1/StrS family aminotransferase [Bryobacteraceae bacterium]|jgi:dTDP-3-amino-3,4,6-trideoxy-alpha-D-glucose transaminase